MNADRSWKHTPHYALRKTATVTPIASSGPPWAAMDSFGTVCELRISPMTFDDFHDILYRDQSGEEVLQVRNGLHQNFLFLESLVIDRKAMRDDQMLLIHVIFGKSRLEVVWVGGL